MITQPVVRVGCPIHFTEKIILACLKTRVDCPCRCQYCQKVLASWTTYSTHVNTHVKNEDLPGTDNVDEVLEHTKVLMTVGLFQLVHDKLISYGDGPAVVRAYKFLTVWCHRAGLKNYAGALLETSYQALVLPPQLAQKLTCHRFVNNQGKVDTCIPIDMDIEHQNNQFKKRLKTHRGEITQQTVDKLSKAHNITKVITSNLARETGYYHGVRHTTPPSQDIQHLFKYLTNLPLFEHQARRSMSAFHVPGNILCCNRTAAEKWAKKKISVFSTKHYYRNLAKQL